jgi:hypothetical protein
MSDNAQLHDEIGGQTLQFDFDALFAPNAEEGDFARAHNDEDVGTGNEMVVILKV